MKEWKFKTKKELESFLIEKWALPKKDDKIDLNYFINKEIINKSDQKEYGKILSIKYKMHSGKECTLFFTELGYEIPIFYTKVYLLNPLTLNLEWIKTEYLVNKGYYILEKDFKSLYYKTEEYKSKLNNSFNEKYGIDAVTYMREKGKKTIFDKYGVNSFLERGKHYDDKIIPVMIDRYGVDVPLKSEDLKKKISNTIKKKYGVDWFLQRGEHYKKITDVMIDRYGIENPFCFTKSSSGSISKIEMEIIKNIISYCGLDDQCETCYSKQKIIYYTEENKRRWYTIDFYNKNYNIAIEIQGDYWHCNPLNYKKDYLHPEMKITAEEIWKRDIKKKVEVINQLGCEYITIWVSEWKLDKIKILNYLKLCFQK